MPEIDEDGVEIAGDGYDWGRDARELVPEPRAEIERLRVRVAELEEALDAIIHLNSPEAGWNAVQAKAIARAALIDKEDDQ